MNSTHMAAVGLSFGIYALMAAAFFGWGQVAIRLMGLEKRKGFSACTTIWTVWAFVLLFFQLIHFAAPLTALIVIPVLVLGGALTLPKIVNNIRPCPDHLSRRRLVTFLGAIAVALAASGWIASRSMLPPVNYDTGLYHLNTMRWINTFPIVPGLGNLHGRLAYNQSFFTYAAALNFYPLFGHGRSVANSFLLLLTMATFIDILRPIFRRPSLLVKSDPFRYAAVLFAFPICGYLAISSNGLSSPSPDLTSALLQITMFVILCQGVSGWQWGETDQHHRAILGKHRLYMSHDSSFQFEGPFECLVIETEYGARVMPCRFKPTVSLLKNVIWAALSMVGDVQI
jgi:hypothetical protein